MSISKRYFGSFPFWDAQLVTSSVLLVSVSWSEIFHIWLSKLRMSKHLATEKEILILEGTVQHQCHNLFPCCFHWWHFEYILLFLQFSCCSLSAQMQTKACIYTSWCLVRAGIPFLIVKGGCSTGPDDFTRWFEFIDPNLSFSFPDLQNSMRILRSTEVSPELPILFSRAGSAMQCCILGYESG